jgi:hypothetical protein
VYDALNVLNAMDIIRKDRNHIFYNPKNTIIPSDELSESEEQENQTALEAEKQRVRQKQLA